MTFVNRAQQQKAFQGWTPTFYSRGNEQRVIPPPLVRAERTLVELLAD
jgi:hypothetical protein